jgi:hypothetical protein
MMAWSSSDHVFLFPLVLILRVTHSGILANECPVPDWVSAYYKVHNIIQHGTIQHAVKHIHVCSHALSQT